MGRIKEKQKLGHGIFDKENMKFTMGNKLFAVKDESYNKQFREKEDAGGGSYWAKRTEIVARTVEKYTVWNGDEYIGDIIVGSSVNFRDPQRHHIALQPK